MSVTRPVVNVYSTKGDKAEAVAQIPIPDVFQTPIRPDIVATIHKYCAMNLRQPHGVNQYAGFRASAESWGTGRAVSRIPRVAGGGTHRAGQGTFGNMCRGGRMFAPKRTWRIWAHQIPTNQRRYAHASAIAASSIPALVFARGHTIDGVSEIPLVISNDIESAKKTKEIVAILKKLKIYSEVLKAKHSKKIRAGMGKNRGRKYKKKLGPLIVFKDDKGVSLACRNLPGVQTASVNRLNLLQLAPGGQVGRLIIWTQSAFEALGARFGSATNSSSLKKRSGATYQLPKTIMTNTDLVRYMQSDEVQNVVRAPFRKPRSKNIRKKNPLSNFGFAMKLNPYLIKLKRRQLLQQVARERGAPVDPIKEQRALKKQQRFAAAKSKLMEKLF